MFAQSCREPEKPIYYMSQEFKDYVDFPVGSWWVYEDSITGEIDSISLIYSEYEIIYNHDLDYQFENLTQRYRCKDSTLVVSASCEDTGLSYLSGNGFKSIIYFFLSESGYSYFQPYNLELISVSDTLVINGVEYYDVVCIRAIGQNTYLYYWSKNIGLVKIKSETDNRQLKSYHINN